MEEYTKYSEICDRAFNKIGSADFINFTKEEAYAELGCHIPSACAMFTACKKDLEDRDDYMEQFNFAMDDKEKQTLAYYVIVEYLEANYINTTLVLKPFLVDSSYKEYKNKQHLELAMELRDKYKTEADTYSANNSYQKSNIFNIVKKNYRRR